MADSLGIVIPAYRPDVTQLKSYVFALDEYFDPAEIHIELDAAPAEVREALLDLPVTVNAVPQRQGKGTAITRGFERLRTDVRVFVDADGSTPVESVSAVTKPLLEGEADLGIGSRRHPDSQILAHQTRARRRMGDAFAWLARRVLDVTVSDYQCGAKAIRAEGWHGIRQHMTTPGFGWDIEFLAIADALDLRIVEVPIVWTDQPNSTVPPFTTALELLWILLRSYHRGKCVRGSRVHRFVGSHWMHRTPLISQLSREPMDQ